MEIRDVVSLIAAALALMFGTRLWLRDKGKDGAADVRAFVRLEAAVEALGLRLAELRSEVHGLAVRLEARDAADHEAGLRELAKHEARDTADHEAVRREMAQIHGEVRALTDRVTRAEKVTGAMPIGSVAPPSVPPASRR